MADAAAWQLTFGCYTYTVDLFYITNTRTRRGDRRFQSLSAIDIVVVGPLPSIGMSPIGQAIADRQAEIDLQAEIKALTDVERLLGASAPASRSRRSSTAKTTAGAAEDKSDAKPARKRRAMSAAERKAASERMTAYWAQRRSKAAKK